MKQLLFLLLFPAFAVAQYPGNANQKITLGEQTTADGLVYRGVAVDTTRKPSVDTMAYILLDTNTNIIWQYKKATSNAWTRINLLPSDTTSMLTNYYRSGLALGTPLSGVLTNATGLPISTGLTGLGAANRIPYASSTTQLTTSSGLTFDGTNFATTGTATATRFNPTGTSATGNGMYLPAANTLGFSTNGTEKMRITSDGKVGIGTISPLGNLDIATSGNTTINITAGSTGLSRFIFGTTSGDNRGFIDYDNESSARAMIFRTNENEAMRITSGGEVWIGYTADNGAYPLQVNGQIFATNATIATSDEKFKENITPLNKGLEIVNKLKPVTFNFISDTKNNFSEYEEVGFIAQDVDRALSTETFSKSIVKSADDSEPTSTMGLATQNLIPILVKAIQEQQALIKALEQRIINLENK